MADDFPGQSYPTKEELKAWYLTTIASDAGRKDFEVNVLVGGEYEMRANALATMAAPAFANEKLQLLGYSPLTAQGDQLINGAKAWGVEGRPASTSIGRVDVAMAAVGTQTILDGFQGAAPNGVKVKAVGDQTVTGTLVGGQIVVTGDSPILVETVDGGAGTELTFGTKITWESPALGLLKRDCKVAAGGITGGRDADGPETIRTRWLLRLANAANGYNWAEIQVTAENVSSAIERAWIYPAMQGPASVAIALSSDGDDRSVATAIVNAVAAAVVAKDQGSSRFNVTTVTDEQVDVVIGLDLPRPISAGGPGGGWLDVSPWPSTADPIVKVTAIDSATGQITTSATVLNTVAVGSHIAIWVPADKTMYSFTITDAQIGGGFVKLISAEGFPSTVVGAYISTGCANASQYADTLRASLMKTGPGEKSSSVWIMPRASRQPTEDIAGRMSLASWVLTDLQNAHAEIEDLSWRARYETGTTTPKTSPTVPSSSGDPPNILTLKHFAFTAIT